MVFHLSDEDGFPVVPQRMRLLDAANDTILRQIAVSENGLGRCTFQPEAGKSYRLQAEYDGRFINFPLQTEASGTALQAAVSRDRLSCRIFSSDEKEVHLFLYQAETGLTEIPLPGGKRAAVLDLSGYPRGVYTLFLTDGDFRRSMSAVSGYRPRNSLISLSNCRKRYFRRRLRWITACKSPTAAGCLSGLSRRVI